MSYLSLKDLKTSAGRLPEDRIILRSVNYGKKEHPNYLLNIPRQISTKAGIDFDTLVDVQYDAQKSMFRIQLTKDVNGFKVHAQKHTDKWSKNPPSRVTIQFPFFEQAKLPKIKKPVLITEYEFNQGLTMRIPEDGRPAKG